MAIQYKSIHDLYAESDGKRYYLETLWPEEIQTKDIYPFEWIKILAPSYYLQQVAKEKGWDRDTFCKKYQEELKMRDRKPLVERLKSESQSGMVTLLYSTPSVSTCSVRYLKEFLTDTKN